MSGAGDQREERWTFGTRLIDDQIPRATWRTTLTYKFSPTFLAGMEYNPTAGKFSPLANWLLMPENTGRPALMLGTSSDRIGTPSGQSFYLTVSKNVRGEGDPVLAPYLALTYGTYDDKFRVGGGMSIGFTRRLSSMILFDGVHVHPMLNYDYRRHTLSFLLVRGRDPGISYSISF